MAITGEQGNDVIIEIGSKEDPSTCLQQRMDLLLTGERRFPSDLIEELQSLTPWPTECCIYKVPVNLRSINESAYTPKVISIGPLHHGAVKLQPMEAHKRRYLNFLLHRKSNIILEDLVQVLRVCEGRARNCYEDESTRYLTSDQFVEIMLLDSCYILTFFLLVSNINFTCEEHDPISRFLLSLHEDFTFEEHDPLSKIGPLYGNVYGDLMLLENQLPFFILDHLFYLIFPTAPPNTFLKSTFHYLGKEMERDHFDHFVSSGYHQVKHFIDLKLKCNLPYETLKNPTYNNQVKHFIDMKLKCHLPYETLQTPTYNNAEIQSPSATTLHKSGIKFKKRGSGCFLDIKLTNVVLEIPFLFIGDATEETFRNLVAMEQCHESSTSYTIDYIFLMDNLIDTPDDVALLRFRGIISNGLGSDEDVCHLFNNITKGVALNPQGSHYSAIIEDVNAHYNRRWNLWKAHLKRVYFRNPWTIISLIAALVLLICTLIQTASGVISVYK